MSSYFVAQIQINDNDEYQKYLDGVDEVFSRYNGKYLAVDGDPKILEGQWSYNRIVIIEFSNEDELKRWYTSEDYQNLLQYRLKAAQCDTLIVKGLER